MFQALSRHFVQPALRWSRPFARLALVQAIVQVAGAVAGIIVVRNLAKTEYAHYTIANTVLSALVVLADSGIGASVAGIGGRVWENPRRLGATINAALDVRRTLYVLLVIPVSVVLVALMEKNGVALPKAAVLLLLVVGAAFLSLGSGILIVVPRLRGEIKFLQRVLLVGAGLRLALISGFAVIGLDVEASIFAILVSYAAQYGIMRIWLQRHVENGTKADPLVRQELLGIVRRQLPNALYYIFQSQIGVWLLSVLGTADGVADLGAITRIGVVFTVLFGAAENVILPRYSRCQESVRLPLMYAQIVVTFILMSIIVVVGIALAPHAVLWIFGPQYAHLSAELLLATISAALTTLNGLTWSLNSMRAWFPPTWLYISSGLLTQAVLLFAIGASTVSHALDIAIVMNLSQIAISMATTAVRMRVMARPVAQP